MADELDRRAAFAETFKNTTNLDQRRRFAQDISEAKAREEERANAEFEQMQRDNPELMNAVTRRQAERRMLGAEVNRRDLAERKFQWDQEKGSRLESLNAKRLELQMIQEDRLMKKAEFDMEKQKRDIFREERAEADMLEFDEWESSMAEAYGKGTPQYGEAVMGKLVSLKYLDKDFRKTVAGELGAADPEAAIEEARQFMQAGGTAVRNIPLGSGAVGTMEAAGSPGAQKVDLARLDRIKKLRAEILAKPEKRRTEGDRDLLGYYDNEIKSIAEKRAGAEPTQISPELAKLKVTPGTPINADKVREILRLSGGDKEKARETAIQLGYVIK